MRNCILLIAMCVLVAGSAQAELVRYFDFEVDAVTDSSSYGINATNHGVTSSTNVAGPIAYRSAKAAYFNGAYLDLGDVGIFDMAQAGGASVSVWVQTETLSSASIRTVFSEGSATDTYATYTMWAEGSQSTTAMTGFIRPTATSANVSVSTTATTCDGTWHHVVWTDNGGTVKMYVDGVLDTTFTYPYAVGDIETVKTLIGARYQGGSAKNTWYDRLDDVAIYDQVLTAAQAAALAAGALPADVLTVANNPSPSDEATDVDIAAQLGWSAPDAFTATGYDVYFGTEPNSALPGYDMEKIVDNQLVLTADPALHSSLTGDMDNGTTYYWQVDVYDSNTPAVLYEGPIWSFSTITADFPPTVTAGDSYKTWLAKLPQVVDATVSDGGEGDLASVTWEIISGPGFAVDGDAQLVDRSGDLGNITGEPNLIRDWIGTDSRGVDEANSDVLTVILSGLPAGTYNWLSYHHDASDWVGDVFDVIVTDSTGSTTTTGVTMSQGTADPNTFATTITSDGSDVTVAFVGGDYSDGVFVMNGFDLTGTGDPLKIDFGRNVPNTVMTGYQAYTAVHEDLASFTTQSYSAFGTTVDVTPTWDAPGGTIESAGGTLFAPTATLNVTDAPKVTGTYTLQVTATDGTAQSDSATLEVQVYADGCVTAVANGATLNLYDADGNCVIDLSDLAAFAAEWLDDIRLTDVVVY